MRGFSSSCPQELQLHILICRAGSLRCDDWLNCIVWTVLSKENSTNSPPRYEAGGWVQWPDNEDYSIQFRRVLGSAQEGASTVSECFMAAAAITAGDDESWHRAWKFVADVNKQRGDLAFAAGSKPSALANWLRASNYYRTSEVFLKLDDIRRADALEQMRSCSHLVVRHQPSSGELVRIPCFESGFVEAYFLPAPGVERRSPTVVCIGGSGHFKDDHLHTLIGQAQARGLSLLLVDLPGQGAVPRIEGRVRYEIETAISCCVDYLLTRADVDDQRIAIFGDSLGAAYASRAASLDDRFAAAVTDAGIWDTLERASTSNWMSGKDLQDALVDEMAKIQRHGSGTQVKCPTLVAVGERDWIDVKRATELCDILRKSGADITLKIFPASETGASHAQTDNPTIGHEYIFDWICSRLKSARAGSHL